MQRLAVTPGEPAGIGPELLVRLVQQPMEDCELVAVADPALLEATAQALRLPLQLAPFDPTVPRPSGNASLSVRGVPLATRVLPGVLQTENAGYVLATLRQAAQLSVTGAVHGVVTGPVHKGVINDAGVHFTGHTEFFAEHAGVSRVVMMLATPGLRVALATTHLPLKEVSAAISKEGLTEIIEILHAGLVQQFGLRAPRILVCGLNPHAGEGGHLGMEEINVIDPVLAQLRSRGMDLTGPLPADTLFTPRHLDHADAVLAMYHDQGLPVLKFKGFGKAVNITLGLPYIRTSVDHGTALDLAGRGTASFTSLAYAIEVALEMSRAKLKAQAEVSPVEIK